MEILSDVDEAHCLCGLAYGLYERGSLPIIVQKNFLLSNTPLLVVTLRLYCNAYRWFFLRGRVLWNLKLTAHPHLVPWHRMCGGIPLFHSNQVRY
jgi:hypothetical protein